jgi:putative ABC transport system permease protein
MASQLFGVSALDPRAYIGVATVLATAATIACYVPARRASLTDPNIALKAD